MPGQDRPSHVGEDGECDAVAAACGKRQTKAAQIVDQAPLGLLDTLPQQNISQDGEIGHCPVEAAGRTIQTVAVNRPVAADHAAIVAGPSVIKSHGFQRAAQEDQAFAAFGTCALLKRYLTVARRTVVCSHVELLSVAWIDWVCCQLAATQQAEAYAIARLVDQSALNFFLLRASASNKRCFPSARCLRRSHSDRLDLPGRVWFAPARMPSAIG